MLQDELDALLIALPVEEIEACFRRLFSQLYLEHGSYGLRSTHDGQVVMFQESRFDHAFFTSSDQANLPGAKDKLRKGSLERMRWIDVLIRGDAPSSACFEIQDLQNPELSPKRLYAHYAKPFVVWLEPREIGGWRFSSAYQVRLPQVYRYTRGATTIWKSK